MVCQWVSDIIMCQCMPDDFGFYSPLLSSQEIFGSLDCFAYWVPHSSLVCLSNMVHLPESLSGLTVTPVRSPGRAFNLSSDYESSHYCSAIV